MPPFKKINPVKNALYPCLTVRLIKDDAATLGNAESALAAMMQVYREIRKQEYE